MRRLLLPILLLVLANASAEAEDFTGFYAGLNAGYGSGKERDRDAVAPGTGAGRTDSSLDLPPSARGAALRRSERAGTTTPNAR